MGFPVLVAVTELRVELAHLLGIEDFPVRIARGQRIQQRRLARAGTAANPEDLAHLRHLALPQSMPSLTFSNIAAATA